MGRPKGSSNKTDCRVPPSGNLTIEEKLKLIAVIIIDRIIADIDNTKAEAKANV